MHPARVVAVAVHVELRRHQRQAVDGDHPVSVTVQRREGLAPLGRVEVGEVDLAGDPLREPRRAQLPAVVGPAVAVREDEQSLGGVPVARGQGAAAEAGQAESAGSEALQHPPPGGKPEWCAAAHGCASETGSVRKKSLSTMSSRRLVTSSFVRKDDRRGARRGSSVSRCSPVATRVWCRT